MSTESAVVAAATAAVFSPRTRETLRRGAVLGVTGAFKVGDVVAGAARGATRGIRGDEQAPTSAGRTNGGTGTAPATAKPRRSNASSRPSRAARPTRATSS